MIVTYHAGTALFVACVLVVFGALSLYVFMSLGISDLVFLGVGWVMLLIGFALLIGRKRVWIILRKAGPSCYLSKSLLKMTEQIEFTSADVAFVLLERYRTSTVRPNSGFNSRLSLVLKNGEKMIIGTQGDSGFVMLKQLLRGEKVIPIFSDEAQKMAVYLGVSVKNQL